MCLICLVTVLVHVHCFVSTSRRSYVVSGYHVALALSCALLCPAQHHAALSSALPSPRYFPVCPTSIALLQVDPRFVQSISAIHGSAILYNPMDSRVDGLRKTYAMYSVRLSVNALAL